MNSRRSRRPPAIDLSAANLAGSARRPSGVVRLRTSATPSMSRTAATMRAQADDHRAGVCRSAAVVSTVNGAVSLAGQWRSTMAMPRTAS